MTGPRELTEFVHSPTALIVRTPRGSHNKWADDNKWTVVLQRVLPMSLQSLSPPQKATERPPDTGGKGINQFGRRIGT